MGDVLDRWQLNQGYPLRDNETQELEIRSFVATLNREGVPADAYNELYERAIKTRAVAIQHGRNVPAFGVELLIAEWNGENGLRRERQERAKISADRQLEMPKTQPPCDKCYGLGKILFGDFKGRPCPCGKDDDDVPF